MKNIKPLNILLSIILILGIAYLIVGLLVSVYYGMFPIETFNKTTPISLASSQIIINQIIIVFTLIGLYKLRAFTIDFYKRKLFNKNISKKFKQIGLIIITACICYIIMRWLAQWYLISKVNFKIDFFRLFMNLVAALFFFTLSTMIDKAKGIQNENDLII